MNWILASQSPRRQELLKLIREDFQVLTIETPEVIDPNDPPHVAVMALAYEKAKALADSMADSGKQLEGQQLVIAADTVVFCDGFMGKPKDSEDAQRMLERLSGSVHEVYTGYCLFQTNSNVIIIDYVKTVVEMKHLTSLEISDYISSGEPMDKAGAYGIQGSGARFIRAIQGDYYNVMGLPVNHLYEALVRHFNW